MTAREMRDWMPAASLAPTPSEADMRAAVQEGVEELPEAPVRVGWWRLPARVSPPVASRALVHTSPLSAPHSPG